MVRVCGGTCLNSTNMSFRTVFPPLMQSGEASFHNISLRLWKLCSEIAYLLGIIMKSNTFSKWEVSSSTDTKYGKTSSSVSSIYFRRKRAFSLDLGIVSRWLLLSKSESMIGRQWRLELGWKLKIWTQNSEVLNFGVSSDILYCADRLQYFLSVFVSLPHSVYNTTIVLQ